MIKISEYKQSKKEREKIQEAENKYRVTLNKKKNEISDKFWEAERILREQKNKEQSALYDEDTKLDKEFNKQRKPSNEKINAYNRVLKFIGIAKATEELNPRVYFYDYPRGKNGEIVGDQKEQQYIEPFKVIKDDEFVKIKVFISRNDKPKNKYTLCIIGATIFNKEILEVPYSYGLDVRTEGNNIAVSLKDAPETNDLVIWYEKNKDKILKNFLEEHKKVEEEYIKVVEETQTKEWQRAYWEDLKYYYENSYVNGTETEEYKKVLEELIKLD